MTQEEDEGSAIDLEIALWLNRWEVGDLVARDRLVENLYPQLRRMASHHMYRSNRDPSMQVDDLVHELYLSLEGQQCTHWKNRSHFFAIAGRLTRRILVDHERRRSRHKRGGGRVPLPIEETAETALGERGEDRVEILALSRALTQLESIDKKAAHLVFLRYFEGLNHAEKAEELGIGRATVTRRWRSARAWLRRRLEGKNDRGDFTEATKMIM